MRIIRVLIAVFIIISAAAPVVRAEAKAYSSAELIAEANSLDGRTVRYKGEIVAAIMRRGDHAWINLNDGFNAIGVWCRYDMLSGVEIFGDYKNEGDNLEVTGVFHRACPAHGGELDIHAGELAVTARGFAIPERISARRINVAAAFFVLTLLSIFVFRRRI